MISTYKAPPWVGIVFILLVVAALDANPAIGYENPIKTRRAVGYLVETTENKHGLLVRFVNQTKRPLMCFVESELIYKEVFLRPQATSDWQLAPGHKVKRGCHQ